MFLRLTTLSLLGLAAAAVGQESVTPAPSQSRRSVRISFLPPPLDGTISLGIYDTNGKLVRVLHRQADLNEFNIGTDALSTTWDGKDDAQENVPPGKYTAHGFAVGTLGVKSVGFFFNDFVTNADSPRIRHLGNVRLQNNELHLDVDLPDDARATLVCDPKQGAFLQKLPPEDAIHCTDKPVLPNVAQTIDCDFGMNNTLWVIDGLEGGARREIKQLSQARELLRRMPIAEKTEPQPQAIAASTGDDRIFLVEEASSVDRLRALSLAESKTDGANSEVSGWKTDFEKRIIEHRNFSIENGKPIPSNPKNRIPLEKVPVKLPPNLLLGDERVTVELTVGFDADGSFLKTSDGLPLFSVNKTPGLIRTLLVAHGLGGIDVFQDDGAVVEQFRVTGLDQMMSFDCGGFELK